MNQNIITYYIPQNLNITKGKIYNLYINKIKNLDLSSIVPSINKAKEKIITITENDLKEILEISNTQATLYNKSQELIKKITKERK